MTAPLRPANTRCATCPYWASAENELASGECRRGAPTETEQYVAGLRVMGSEALRRFISDDETSPAARAEVEAWFARNERRLPQYQPRIKLGVWPVTLGEHWCGEHPRFKEDLKGD